MSGLCEQEFKQIKTQYEVIQNTLAYRIVAYNIAPSVALKTRENNFCYGRNLSRKEHRNIKYNFCSWFNCRKIYCLQQKLNPVFTSTFLKNGRIQHQADYFVLQKLLSYNSTYYLKSLMRFLWIFMQKSSTVVLQ